MAACERDVVQTALEAKIPALG